MPKKKGGKLAIFGPTPWVNPFGKISIIWLLELVFIGYKGVFSFESIGKKFPWPILRKKKKVGKMGTFGPKPWVNPLGKILIFPGYELLVFTA